jgi:hypothetical protein
MLQIELGDVSINDEDVRETSNLLAIGCAQSDRAL